jgi:hypothetical protein
MMYYQVHSETVVSSRCMVCSGDVAPPMVRREDRGPLLGDYPVASYAVDRRRPLSLTQIVQTSRRALHNHFLPQKEAELCPRRQEHRARR